MLLLGRSLILGLVCLAMIATSSCSGGRKNGASPAGGTTDTSIATTGNGVSSSPGAPGPDDQRLQNIILSATDLPAGWTGHASVSTPTTQAAADLALAQCLGRRNIDVDLVAGVVSQNYSKGALTIASSARSYLSDDDITTATASFTNPKISTCYQQLMSSPGVIPIVTTATLAVKVTPGPGGGPSNVAAVATVSVGVQSALLITPTTTKTTTRSPTGKPITTLKSKGLAGTIVFITGPRLVAELDFFGIDDMVPAQMRSDLIAKVAARAAAG